MLSKLISFLIDTSYEDLPPDVIKQAKRCIMDWTGVALAGSVHPTVSIMRRTVSALGGNQQASILGTPVKTSVTHAALANGTMSHVLDYDDTHLEALMHPSAPLVPALFAYGEWKGCSGRNFLLSFLMGFEIETRISMAMGASHYDAGWHATATMGRFGAAAGVGKLAGLDRGQMSNALGLAGTQAAGLRNVFGTMAKSFHPGVAAANGLLSVLLAGEGYTSSSDILEAGKGLGSVLSDDFNPKRGLSGMGESYTVLGTSFKPFASCLYTHPTIDAVIQLKKQHNITADAVETIRCGISKFCMDAANQKNPKTGLAAKFSVSFCAALAMLEGRAGDDLFQDAQTGNTEILDLMRRVEIEPIRGLKDSEAKVTVTLKNGQQLKHHTIHAFGSPQNPLSDRQLEEKARTLLTPLLKDEKTDTVIDRLWRLETIGDISEITELLSQS